MTHAYKNPKAYCENNTLQTNFAMRIIANITIDPDSKILDLGCGDGLITSKLAEAAPKGCVVGTDISEAMTAHAAEAYANHRNLIFMPMDASNNIFENQFDLITSFNALHWVKDQSAVLAGIAKAARPNAQVALLLSHKKSRYHHVLDKICSTQEWKDYFSNYISPRSFFERSHYESLLKESGLMIKAIHEEEMTHHFDSPEALKAFFRASMSQIKQIPSSKQSDFLEDFTNAYLADLAGVSITDIPLSFWCLSAHCHKA